MILNEFYKGWLLPISKNGNVASHRGGDFIRRIYFGKDSFYDYIPNGIYTDHFSLYTNDIYDAIDKVELLRYL